MRKLLIGFATAAILTFAGAAIADVYVQGYYRNDGTYVQPHYRSSPDSSRNNNWSVYPNINPYTGQRGPTGKYVRSVWPIRSNKRAYILSGRAFLSTLALMPAGRSLVSEKSKGSRGEDMFISKACPVARTMRWSIFSSHEVCQPVIHLT